MNIQAQVAIYITLYTYIFYIECFINYFDSFIIIILLCELIIFYLIYIVSHKHIIMFPQWYGNNNNNGKLTILITKECKYIIIM